MAKRIANIVLLVEDSCHERLLLRYLKKLGQDNRSVRVVKSPAGRGSAEQFVRDRYGAEVRAIRVRMARTRACLIAMIDADTGAAADRRRQLDDAVQDSGLAPRAAGEAILNLIPKRSVETWVLNLNALPVDEDRDFRHDERVTAEAVKAAAGNLFDWTRPNAQVPASCVPSLKEAIPEFDRLPN